MHKKTGSFWRVLHQRVLGVPFAAAAAVVVVLALGGGGAAYALTASTTAAPSSVYGCVSGSTRVLEHVYTSAANFKACPKGSFPVTITPGTKGPAGPKGATGATGKTGPQGPKGATGSTGVGIKSAVVNSAGDLILTYTDGSTADAGPVVGPAGTSEVSTVNGTVTIDDHGDSSVKGGYWANDNLTADMTLTNNGPVSVSHCSAESSPTSCYFYTATIDLTGMFTTLSSYASPATKESVSLTNGVLTGPVTGSETVEFYYSKDASATNLPAAPINEDDTAYATQDVDYVLQGFFPDGLTDVTPGTSTALSHVDVTGYSLQYGPTSSTCETWIDSSANGDGATAPYGTDITDTDLCAASS